MGVKKSLKAASAFLVLSMLILGGVCFNTVTAQEEVFPANVKNIFTDEILAAEIAGEIGKTVEDEIEKTHLEAITVLDLSGKGITELKGIGHCVNLTELTLDGNEIADIGELKNLTKLKILNISDNRIKNISALEDLTELQELYFNNNEVEDMTPVRKLTDLRVINFSSNKIADLTALKLLTDINVLYGNYNAIRDISDLRNMINLKTVELKGNHIIDLEPLNAAMLDFYDFADQTRTVTFYSKNDQSYELKNAETVIIRGLTGGINETAENEFFKNGIFTFVNGKMTDTVRSADETITVEYTVEILDTFLLEHQPIAVLKNGKAAINPVTDVAEGNIVEFDYSIKSEPSDMIFGIENGYVIGKEAGKGILIISATVRDSDVTETIEVDVTVELKLEIKGLPEKIRVGDVFTLIPNVDNNQGEEGWEYDSAFLSASFSSPATFTVLKTGETSISFTGEGQTATLVFEVISDEISSQPESSGESEIPKTGDGFKLALVLSLFIGSAAIMAISLRKKRV